MDWMTIRTWKLLSFTNQQWDAGLLTTVTVILAVARKIKTFKVWMECDEGRKFASFERINYLKWMKLNSILWEIRINQLDVSAFSCCQPKILHCQQLWLSNNNVSEASLNFQWLDDPYEFAKFNWVMLLWTWEFKGFTQLWSIFVKYFFRRN